MFLGSYSAPFGRAFFIASWVAGLVLVGAALWAHYVRPAPLGPLTPPGRLALAIYGMCVIAEAT